MHKCYRTYFWDCTEHIIENKNSAYNRKSSALIKINSTIYFFFKLYDTYDCKVPKKIRTVLIIGWVHIRLENPSPDFPFIKPDVYNHNSFGGNILLFWTWDGFLTASTPLAVLYPTILHHSLFHEICTIDNRWRWLWNWSAIWWYSLALKSHLVV